MTVSLVPVPQELVETGPGFVLGESAAICPGPGAGAVAERFRAELAAPTGLPLPIRPPGTAAGGAVELVLDSALPAEGYRLDVGPDGVRLVGGDEAGLFHATQSLRQLLPPQALRRYPVRGVTWRLPGVRVADAPRFGWRGFMLDVARHFFGREVIRKLIDALALHHLNVLHLHLTDDQGWRVEIGRYPRLTEVGSWRARSMLGRARDPRPPQCRYDDTPHGGYLSRDDIADLVAYAADRFVTVVPEIDVPGHSQAAIAAYPRLGNLAEPLPVRAEWGVNPHVLNVEEATVDFYRDVFGEILDLFPSRYVHVGGDECPKEEWRASPRAQARMKELGLADEDALQSWFIRQLDDFLTRNGRRLLGWDEIGEGGLASGATVMSWRGEEGGIAAARAGHDVVMAPYDDTYLYLHQTDDPTAQPPGVGPPLTLEKIFGYQPVPAGLPSEHAHHVLGAQAQMWTEFVQSHRHVEQMVFPRLCAFAERVWGSPPTSFPEFRRRLHPHVERLHALDLDVFPL